MPRNTIIGIIIILGVFVVAGTSYLVFSKKTAQESVSNGPRDHEVEQQIEDSSKQLGIWPQALFSEDVYFDEGINHFVVWNSTGWILSDSNPLFLDGVRMPHDLVVGHRFNKAGDRFAYVARENEEEFVVFEGKEGKRYNSIEGTPFFLEDDSLVYGVEHEGVFIVKDGVDVPVYPIYGQFDAIWEEAGHIIHRMFDVEGRPTVFVDGEELDTERSVWRVEITNNGEHILYGDSGGPDEPGYFVIDGVEYLYDKVGIFAIQENGWFAFVAYDKQLDKQFLVLNREEKRDMLCDSIFGLHFDTNGGIAYVCMNEFPGIPNDPRWGGFVFFPHTLKEYSVIWNGKEVYSILDTVAEDGLSWDRVVSIRNFTFNRDSSSIAFTATIEHWSSESFKAPDTVKSLVLVDGIVQTEQAAYGSNMSLAGFTLDDKLVYTVVDSPASRERGNKLIVEGEEQQWDGYLIVAGPFFLDDGRIVAAAREPDGESYNVVIDGEIKNSYDQIFPTSVSVKDGKLIFAARTEREVWRIIEDL